MLNWCGSGHGSISLEQMTKLQALQCPADDLCLFMIMLLILYFVSILPAYKCDTHYESAYYLCKSDIKQTKLELSSAQRFCMECMTSPFVSGM